MGGSLIRELVVRLRADIAGFEAEMGAATGTVSKSSTSMQGALRAGSLIGTAAFALVGFAALKFSESAVKAFISVEQANLKLTNSIANNAKMTVGAAQAFEGLASKIRDLTGASYADVTSAESMLTQFGLTQDQVTTLTPLVVDLSSKMGIDMTTAARAVGKSVEGTAASMNRFGIMVDKAKEAADPYNATVQALAVVQGFAADKAKAEPWLLLGAAYRKLEESVGRGLLPVLKDLVPLLTVGLHVIGDLIPAIIAAGAAFIGWKSAAFVGQLLYTIAGGAGAAVGPLGELGPAGAAGAVGLGLVAYAALRATGALEGLPPALSDVATSTFWFVKAADLSASSGLKQADAMKFVQGKADELRVHLDNTGQVVANFAHMTTADFKTWADDTGKAISSTFDDMNTFSNKWKFTADSASKTMKEMAAKAAVTMHDTAALMTDPALPDKLKAYIAGMGADAIHAYEQMGPKQQQAYRNSANLVLAAQKSVNEIMHNQAKIGGDQAGTGLGEGFIHGIGAETPAMLTAAKVTGTSIVKAFKAALGVASPSRIAHAAGVDFIQGLIEGLQSKDQALNDTATKAAKTITDALNRELTKARGQLSNVLSAAAGFRSGVKGGFGAFTDETGGFANYMQNLVDAAKAKAGALEGATPESIAAAGTAAGVITPGGIQAFFAQQLAGAQQWADVLKQLQGEGISQALLQQIASAGPSSLGFAQGLAAMGPSGIAGINATFGSISALAGQTAGALTQDYFGGKIEELKNKIDETNKLLRDLAKPQKLLLDVRPGSDKALRELILSTIRDIQLQRTSL